MKRNLLRCSLFVLVIALSVVVSSPVLAWSGVYKRGDHQILQNDESGATVRVWVQNSSSCSRHALVTFVGKDLEGTPVQSSYPLWVPARSARPVNITFGFAIGTDPKIIVTTLGSGV